ncbi:MAG: DUF362 domain-containing protein [Phycisphaerae bacterium]|nr:DUF362 domain-containing protein [Phycisphaerae bacterium]
MGHKPNEHGASPRRRGHARPVLHPPHVVDSAPDGGTATGGLELVLGLWRWTWFFLFRNRFAIGIASLVWLIWRSGTQPRRMAYPCQQAAAANLGALAVLVVPILARRRMQRVGADRWRRVRLATGSVALASILFVLVSAGVNVYSNDEEVAAAGVQLPPPRTSIPEPTTVAIVQDVGEPLANAEVERMVRRVVGLAGGLGSIVQPGQTVVIKPNLVETLAPAGDGITTDPRVVRAVVRLVQEAGAGRIVIAEGTASSRNNEDTSRQVTWKAFKDSGYDANGDRLDDETGVELYDLNDTGGLDKRDGNRVSEVTIPNGVIRTKYWVPRMLLKPADGGFCDVLISVPVLKNHGNGAVTLAMKNRVGCAPSDIYHATFAPYTQQMKWSLVHTTSGGFGRTVVDGGDYPVPAATNVENYVVQYTIVDLNLVRPNDFAVVDGLVGITNGPVGDGGVVTKALPARKLVIAGRDSVAVDTIGSLTMGYDPTQVGHIAWADNRALGTGGTALITVVGDHVAAVRMDFPNRGESVAAERSSPWLDSVSLDEGQTVAGTIRVTGSGVGDNNGLAKAELMVKARRPNLLVNGDFETGDASGWTGWESPWGGPFVRDFADAEAGHQGSFCLKLGGSSTTGSFGVHQQVTVEPGKTYRVDAFWRGQKTGSSNWFEILLLDGPFDIDQADSGGEPVVRTNYMYAYDNLIGTGLGGNVGATFGWLWAHSQDGTKYDYNSRHGERTATGNTLTVVLKAGNTGEGGAGVAAWFDDVSLVEVAEERVVASVRDPQDPFHLEWDTSTLPPGDYTATVAVYDAAMNEAAISRGVTVTPPLAPLIAIEPTAFSHTFSFGESPPDDTFTVRNAGIGTLNYEIWPDSSWVVLSSTRGESTGDTDAITIHYDLTGVGAGTQTATLLITDAAAYNDPQVLSIRLDITTVKSDFDRDGDVDLDDWGRLQACLTGIGVVQTDPACENAKLDDDEDVDKNDAALFTQCLSGAGIPADPDCMD